VQLERLGIYRGYAWYEASARLGEGSGLCGVLVREASDVVSVYVDGTYASTVVPGGSSAFIPFAHDGATSDRGEVRLSARTEIWGHTNFDDARLPALRLNALKGMTGMTAVKAVRDLTANWELCLRPDGTPEPWPSDSALLPVVHFGGWLTTVLPASETYRRSFVASAEANAWIVCFDGMEADARLSVNGQDAGDTRPQDPYVDIAPYVTPGRPVTLTVELKRSLGARPGRVLLYEGIEAGDVSGYTIHAADEAALGAAAAASDRSADRANLPCELEPGAMSWLHAIIPNTEAGEGWRIRAEGSGLKLTVWFGGRIVGRLWLPGGEARPTMTGGSPDSCWLPGPWFDAEGGSRLSILLEAVDARQNGRLASLAFIPV